MLFNSYEFIFLFLPLTYIIFYFLSRFGPEKAIGWLVVASLFFYGWWNPAYLILIIISMIVNYLIGKLINPDRQSVFLAKHLLILGIIFNLGLLAYYKYAHFFMENIAALTNNTYDIEQIILPLAISFFTFQQIAFLVDAYRGLTKEYQFLHYALFVTFFPQLIAGPIVHHKEMLPQFLLKKNIKPKLENITIGLLIFAMGLFKKTVLADGVAQYATPVFELAQTGAQIGFFESWGGALSYSFQLYFDFSGYSDMAIGAARLFGIKIPLNFHSPYKAKNISEFWKRWHITLSRFLRDYVYFPLGGNRKGKARRYSNLMITMLLGGLWHGAGWTFIIWGALHGFYLVVNHFWHFIVRKLSLQAFQNSQLWQGTAWLITYLSVVLGWVFFRAEDYDTAMIILQGMMGYNGISIPNGIAIHLAGFADILSTWGIGFTLGGGSQFVWTYLWIIFLTPVVLFFPNTQQFMDKFEPAYNKISDQKEVSIFSQSIIMKNLRFKYTYSWAIFSAALFTFGIFALSHISEFLYFQF